jgi:hypothetical protein
MQPLPASQDIVPAIAGHCTSPAANLCWQLLPCFEPAEGMPMQPKGGAEAPESSNMHAWHQMAGSDTGMPVLCVPACWVGRQSSNCPVSRWPLALPKRIFAPLSLLQVLVLGAAAAPLHLADADQESLLAGPKGAVAEACRSYST